LYTPLENMKILILTKNNCKWCVEAIKLVNSKWGANDDDKVTIENVLTDPKDLLPTGATTYPQVFIDGVHIGGYSKLEEYIDKVTTELILTPNKNRFTVFPIRYPNLWTLYKKAQASNWTAEEIDFSKDLSDWETLTGDEQHFIKYILAFFASADGIVFENINNNFAKEVELPEARSFYAYQEHNEMVHGETYSLLIEKYVKDTAEKDIIFRAIETIPCVQKKAQWALKWFDAVSVPFSERLVAFACVEGIFFSGSFCAIFWLKKRGLMPGLAFSNELISRDEGLHLEFAVELFGMLNKKPSAIRIHQIVTEAVTIEKEFILDALPCRLIGMNSDLMSTYIEYVADRFLKQLGYAVLYGTHNPFDFMENISLDGKTNFFEKRVGDYGKLFDTEDEVSFSDQNF